MKNLNNWTYDKALAFVKQMSTSVGMYARLYETLSKCNNEEKTTISAYLAKQGVTNSIDFILLMEGGEEHE